MKVFQVDVVFPSGKKTTLNVMPGHPMVWPNKEGPAIESEGKRAIVTGEDAAEYVSRTCFNRLSPVDVEWPSECKAREEVLESTKLQMPAVIKNLIGDPGAAKAGG